MTLNWEIKKHTIEGIAFFYVSKFHFTIFCFQQHFNECNIFFYCCHSLSLEHWNSALCAFYFIASIILTILTTFDYYELSKFYALILLLEWSIFFAMSTIVRLVTWSYYMTIQCYRLTALCPHSQCHELSAHKGNILFYSQFCACIIATRLLHRIILFVFFFNFMFNQNVIATTQRNL